MGTDRVRRAVIRVGNSEVKAVDLDLQEGQRPAFVIPDIDLLDTRPGARFDGRNVVVVGFLGNNNQVRITVKVREKCFGRAAVRIVLGIDPDGSAGYRQELRHDRDILGFIVRRECKSCASSRAE